MYSDSNTSHLTSGKRNQYLLDLDRRLGKPQSWSVRDDKEKIKPQPPI
jgi:hypothetical protein